MCRFYRNTISYSEGGGGKTLALSALMQNKDRLVACDISESKLGNCIKRIKRAGVQNCRTYVLDSKGKEWLTKQNSIVDAVLVDAPCSGTGRIVQYKQAK